MNWATFQTHHEAADEAFEAFTCQVFERYLRRQYGDVASELAVLNGAGGDGGVEAFLRLPTGEEIGLQAKWFPGGLDAGAARQIRESIATARKVHPQLRTYVVALPCDLTGPTARSGETGLDRWNGLEEHVAQAYSGLTLLLWDAHRLEEQLEHPGGEDIRNAWFGGTLTSAHLQTRGEVEIAGDFRTKYLPDLHQCGQATDAILAVLRHPDAVLATVDALAQIHARVRSLRDEVDRLCGFPGMGDEAKVATVGAAVGALDAWLATLSAIMTAARDGRPQDYSRVPSAELESDPLDRLFALLHDEDRRAEFTRASTHETLERLADLEEIEETLRHLLDRMRGLRPNLAITGDPGAGKTHAVVGVVERFGKEARPAVLVSAKRATTGTTWAALLGGVLDRPTWSVAQTLSALEARAVAREVEEARSQPPGSRAAPQRAAIIVDALEESAAVAPWADLVAEMERLLEDYPRVALVVTVRTRHAEECLPASSRMQYFEVYPGLDVPLEVLVDAYCSHYRIKIEESRWIRWALRSPLAVRMFAEAHAGEIVKAEQSLQTTVRGLFGEKIARLDAELSSDPSAAWPAHENAALDALIRVARLFLERADMPRSEVVQALREWASSQHGLSASSLRCLLDRAVETGFLVEELVPPDDPLRGPTSVLAPANNVVMDYLLGEELAEGVEALIRAGTAVPQVLPEALFQNYDAVGVAVAALLGSGILATEHGVWREGVQTEELERWQLESLCDLAPAEAGRYQQWVSALLGASLATNRRALAFTVVPCSRRHGHPLGAALLDGTLRPLGVAERDCFWSVPEDLAGSAGRPWEGPGELILDSINLEPDDEWLGCPLVLAWSLSSVSMRRVARARHELSKWGARNLLPLAQLLTQMLDVNDPQVVQETVLATLGAVLFAAERGVDRDGIARVAEVVSEHWFSIQENATREDAVARYGARAIVERAAHVGALRDASMLGRARPPYRQGPLLPMLVAPDQRQRGTGSAFDVLHSDLEWYVAEKSTDGFFSSLRFDPRDPRNNANSGDDDGTAWIEVQLAPAAVTCLREYASEVGKPILAPKQLRDGLIAAYVAGLGWTPRTEGDSAASTRDVDDSIGGQYRRATHGSRSPVCTLGEKYVWCAVSRIAGHLSSRLPRQEVGEPPEPSDWTRDDADLGAGTGEPLSSLVIEEPQPTPAAFWLPTDLLPSVAGLSGREVERALAWLKAAPHPSVLGWPKTSRGGTDLAVLSGFVSARAPDAHVEVLAWMSSFVVPEDHAERLLREAEGADLGSVGDLWEWRSAYSRHRGPGPSIASWAPWLTGAYEQRSYGLATSDERAESITLRALVARGSWSEAGDDHECDLPARWLRDELGIDHALPRAQGWDYRRASGDTLVHYRTFDAAHERVHGSWLTVPWECLLEACRRQGAVPLWCVRLLREIPPVLAVEGGRPPGRAEQLFWLVAPELGSGRQLVVECRSSRHADYGK